MKRLMAGTALMMLVAGPLMAQEATTPSSDAASGAPGGTLFIDLPGQDAMYGSELIGMSVYSSETDYETDYGAGEPVGADARGAWDDIGEVDDILITPEGEVQAVLVDIGGFLGLGERTVALNMDELFFLQDENQDDFIAVTSTRAELENAPEFQRPAATDAAMSGTDQDTGAMGEAAAPAVGTGADMVRPAYQREGYTEADYASLTADDLTGAPVFDGNDQNIGNIDELVLAADGSIDQVVVDVGGFLGIGEHSVAMPFDAVQVMTNADGSDVRAFVDQTKEQLEQRPEYTQ